MKRANNYLKKIIEIINRREMRILPGQLAFFMVLSLVPMATLLFFIFTNFSISLDVITNFIEDSLPREVSALITPNINFSGSFISVIIFMMTGFYIASNGLHSIIVASNVLYNIDGNSFIKRRTKAIFMTLLLIILFITIAILLAFGTSILNIILEFNIIKNFNQELFQLLNILKWPVSFVFTYIIIKILYTIAPDETIPSKYMNKGAFVTTLGWTLVTSLYSFYIGNFANYGIFYGSLSNLVVLMIWIYILAYIFVFGIVINTTFYNNDEIN